ncbi:MAG TPA: DinB family protein [Nocardioidaceae bacterium]|nr:DinB family protein [Nocardioidaceae bacterium]
MALDTKDWTWTLEHRCPECGEDASRIQPEQVPGLVRDCAAQWQKVLSAGGGLQDRPRPDVWSPLEYAGHVLDVLRLFDHRLEQMLTRDDPVFDDWDQDEAATKGRYAEQDPQQVALEIVDAASTLADRFESVPTQDGLDWERPGRRSDGAPFTVIRLARYLLHELVHHLHDVRFATHAKPPTT